MSQNDRSDSGRLWCVIVRSQNVHDFEVWGPYTDAESDEVWERLADRSDVRGPVGKLTRWPMSRDWDTENEADDA